LNPRERDREGLPDAPAVLDAFHVVKLAIQVDKFRRRVPTRHPHPARTKGRAAIQLLRDFAADVSTDRQLEKLNLGLVPSDPTWEVRVA